MATNFPVRRRFAEKIAGKNSAKICSSKKTLRFGKTDPSWRSHRRQRSTLYAKHRSAGGGIHGRNRYSMFKRGRGPSIGIIFRYVNFALMPWMFCRRSVCIIFDRICQLPCNSCAQLPCALLTCACGPAVLAWSSVVCVSVAPSISLRCLGCSAVDQLYY